MPERECEGVFGREISGFCFGLEGEEEFAEGGGEDGHEDGCNQDGGDGPDDQGVPLPGPEGAGRGERVVAHSGEHGVFAHGEGGGVEDAVTEVQEDEEHGQLEGIDEVVGDLGGDQVEAEHEGDREADEGGRAEEGIDADGYADGQGPSKAAGRCTDPQEMDDWRDDSLLKDL